MQIDCSTCTFRLQTPYLPPCSNCNSEYPNYLRDDMILESYQCGPSTNYDIDDNRNED